MIASVYHFYILRNTLDLGVISIFGFCALAAVACGTVYFLKSKERNMILMKSWRDTRRIAFRS